ncbi:unnamed protein product [Cylicocyclus nassatus]|uniref:Uncharacterized protein n=1 Tax=Cylicocyclus nassatus TaxID=53992 RepID=A0AA36GMF5_CYLNA|nr:unnamed protein product [Cylicocyclus nassatus]
MENFGSHFCTLYTVPYQGRTQSRNRLSKLDEQKITRNLLYGSTVVIMLENGLHFMWRCILLNNSKVHIRELSCSQRKTNTSTTTA